MKTWDPIEDCVCHCSEHYIADEDCECLPETCWAHMTDRERDAWDRRNEPDPMDLYHRELEDREIHGLR